jgi:hypothetical protein
MQGGKIAMDVVNKIKQGFEKGSHLQNSPVKTATQGKGMGQ